MLWCQVCARGGGRTGEGSFGQLVRRYGWEGARQVVARLGCVWISHIHADHHGGLPRLLAVRAGARFPQPFQQMSGSIRREPLVSYAAYELAAAFACPHRQVCVP